MKKIRKIASSIGIVGKILNAFSNSTENTYCCDYINNQFKTTKITDYEMLNGCEIVPEIEPFRFLKNGNIVSLNCVIKVPTTFNKEEALNVMKIPNNLASKGYLYKMTGVCSTETFGYRVNAIANLVLLTDGTIMVKVNDDNIKYVNIDLIWILED